MRPLGVDLDVGAGAHGALGAADHEFLPIANERDGRLRSATREQSGALGLDEGRVRRIGTERGEQGEPGGAGFQIDCGGKVTPAVGQVQASDVASAHGSVPARTDLAAVVGGDAYRTLSFRDLDGSVTGIPDSQVLLHDGEMDNVATDARC